MLRIRLLTLGALIVLGTSQASAQTPAAKPTSVPSFVNDVEPILTRLGCNQGACHGKGSGQNGFRLSLRGFAPEWDHPWITREFTMRRINPTNPEASLFLQKPTGQAPHEGGVLMTAESREYRVLLDWIRGGAPGINKDDPTIRRLDIVSVSPLPLGEGPGGEGTQARRNAPASRSCRIQRRAI